MVLAKKATTTTTPEVIESDPVKASPESVLTETTTTTT